MQKGLIVHTFIVDDEKRVLITRRSVSNDRLPRYWDIPGGTLEDGEDPAIGAMREVKEETGLDITRPRLFFQKSNVDTAKNKQFVTLIFFARHARAEVTVNPEEHDSYEWISLSDIAKYDTVDYMKEAADVLSEYI